jgi:Family of unknown function (DUF5681)
MANDEFPPDYEVGFAKPPEASRFPKGVSGNPRGRPKGALNFKTLLRQTLSEKVVITENGKRKIASKFEAVIWKLVSKAMKGDMVAVRLLLSQSSFMEMEEIQDSRALCQRIREIYGLPPDPELEPPNGET